MKKMKTICKILLMVSIVCLPQTAFSMGGIGLPSTWWGVGKMLLGIGYIKTEPANTQPVAVINSSLQSASSTEMLQSARNAVSSVVPTAQTLQTVKNTAAAVIPSGSTLQNAAKIVTGVKAAAWWCRQVKNELKPELKQDAKEILGDSAHEVGSELLGGIAQRAGYELPSIPAKQGNRANQPNSVNAVVPAVATSSIAAVASSSAPALLSGCNSNAANLASSAPVVNAAVANLPVQNQSPAVAEVISIGKEVLQNVSNAPVGQKVKAFVQTFTAPVGDQVVATASNATKAVKEQAAPSLEKLHAVADKGWSETRQLVKKVALWSVGIIAAWYTFRFIGNRVENWLNRPQLDYKLTKPSVLKDAVAQNINMVFEFAVKEQLNAILTTTASFKQEIQGGNENTTYRNYLLYGPPGNGKQMFVRMLAKQTRMNLYEISSSALMKYTKENDAATALDDFFNMVEKNSADGSIIYMENPTALFSKRKAESSRFITVFNEHVEKRNSKYMLVVGLTYRPESTLAFDDMIAVNKPSLNERKELLRRYREQYYIIPTDCSRDLAQSAQTLLADEKLTPIATKMEGASARDISLFLKYLKVEAQLKKPGILTQEIIDKAVDRAVGKIVPEIA